MNVLERIERGKKVSPPRILVYGTEGLGKSTFASKTPNPIFTQTEDGLGQIDCHKFPLATSFDEVMTAITSLANEPHDYQTVVVDSLDWLERLIFDAVCRAFGATSIERGVAHPIGKDGGERILRTVGGPACVAKNRYSLPAELPLDWNALLTGISQA